MRAGGGAWRRTGAGPGIDRSRRRSAARRTNGNARPRHAGPQLCAGACPCALARVVGRHWRGCLMHIAMIGSGYVGLVSGACLADFGHDVVCVDKDEAKISALRRGEIPIFEPGLNDLIAGNAGARRLSFTTDLAKSVAAAAAVFIAVGTPSRRGDGHADLSYVYAAAREIAAAVEGFTVIITKSTVPVGTGDEVARIIHESR